jgi:hypothetical protein
MKQYDKNKSVFYERYKPSCVEDLIIPNAIKTKLINYIKTQDIPNIGLFSSNPGCVLPGTSISVYKKEIFLSYKEVKHKYNLNKHEMCKLKNYVPYLDKQFDDNLIQKCIIDIVKLRGPIAYSFDLTFKHDKKYNNKFLKVFHWVHVKNSIEEAISETLRLRKFAQYFNINATINKDNFNPENINESILKICFDVIYSHAKKITDLYPNFDKSTTSDFWIVRGWNKEQAKQKISEI